MSYSIAAASRAAGVPVSRVRYLIRIREVSPRREGRRLLLSFADVARIRKWTGTRRRAVSPAQLALPLTLPAAVVRNLRASAGAVSIDALRDQAALAELQAPQQALALYERIAALTDAADDWANLLAYLHERGQQARAAALARRLRRDQPQSAIVQFNCGAILHAMGSHADAAAAYEAALSMDAALVEAHRFLHDCYDRLGQPQLAIRHASAWRRHQHDPR